MNQPTLNHHKTPSRDKQLSGRLLLLEEVIEMLVSGKLEEAEEPHKYEEHS